MKLIKIELENIKTHKKSEIRFKDGLNVLHGKNGTGKSSVVQMIGFVLFDYLKSNKHEDYLRKTVDDEPSTGRVTLKITGLDDRSYTIQRTIGKTGVEVRDGLTNKKIMEVTSIGQLNKWVRDQIGLKSDIELKKLFETSIGVSQGTFIEPFLYAPRDRKDYFDPILQVEIYNTLWDRLLNLGKEYVPVLDDIRGQIHELQGELKSTIDYTQKQASLNQEITGLKEELQVKKQEAGDINKQFEKLKKVKQELELTEKEYEKVKIKEYNIEKSIGDLKELVEEAKQARDICNQTKGNYNNYVKFSEQEKMLEEKKIQLDDLITSINIKKEEFATVQATIKNIDLNIHKIKENQMKLEELEPKNELYKQLEDRIKLRNEDLAIIESHEKDLEKNEKRYENLIREMDEIGKNMGDYPALLEKQKTLSTLDTQKNDMELHISVLKNEIAFFQNNFNKIEQNLCPFSNQPCKNSLEGTLDASILQQQIITKNSELNEKILSIIKVKQDLKQKNTIDSKIEVLKEQKTRIQLLIEQLKVLKADIDGLKSKTLQKSVIKKETHKLEQELISIKTDVDEYRYINGLIKDLPALIEKRKPLVIKVKEITLDMKELETRMKSLEEVPKDLRGIKEKREQCKTDYNAYQTNIRTAEKLSERTKRMDDHKSDLNAIKKTINNLLKTITETRKAYDEQKFEELEMMTKKYNTILVEIDIKLNEKQEQLDEVNQNLEILKNKKEQLDQLKIQERKMVLISELIDKMRIWIHEFIPKLRKVLILKINRISSEIYRDIRDEENAELKLTEDYDIIVANSSSSRSFFQLSGGEKMSAALSVRLALLKILSTVEFAFFDEPTPNLDDDSCVNLSKYINTIKGFKQLFVISHDDTFKRQSEYVIKFSKDDKEMTIIDY